MTTRTLEEDRHRWIFTHKLKQKNNRHQWLRKPSRKATSVLIRTQTQPQSAQANPGSAAPRGASNGDSSGGRVFRLEAIDASSASPRAGAVPPSPRRKSAAECPAGVAERRTRVSFPAAAACSVATKRSASSERPFG